MKNRIYIFTQEQLCKLCKDKCAEFDGLTPDCDVCSYKELPNITEKKALRVMGEAMRARGELCSFTYQTLALHGLRALLENTK